MKPTNQHKRNHAFRRLRMKLLQMQLDAATITQPGSQTRGGVSLAELKPGECGYVDSLTGAHSMRLRLLEIGITEGVHVQVMRVAAFGGPIDVDVRGFRLSMRREEAAHVWLRPLQP